MQKQLLCCAFLALCLSLQAQWNLSGNSNATSASKLGTTNSIPLNLVTDNVTRMRIATDGKVGIGTTSPQQRLHVEGSANQAIFVSTTAVGATSGSGMIGYAKGLPTATGNRLGYFLVGSRGGGESGYNAAGMVGYAGGAWTGGSSHPAYLAFETTPLSSASRIERVRITQDGNVGIGTSEPSSPLHVSNVSSGKVISAISSYQGNGSGTGIYGSSINAPGFGYGVRGYGGYRGVTGDASGSSYTGEMIGVYGTASGSAGVGTRTGAKGVANGGKGAYGVWGDASGASDFNAAGYFNGKVWASSYGTVSDRKFKEDVKPLDNSLEGLMKLRPAAYQFKTEEFKGMHLPKGRQIGLMADEVKQVYPELVEQAIHPAKYDEEGRKEISPEIRYEGVNYQGLIPVLIASVQEQQGQIEQHRKENEALRRELAELKAMISKLANGGNAGTALSSASLGVANPNPATGTASISYNIPAGSKVAHLLVTDLRGSLIKQILLNSRGNGRIALNTAALAAGTYTYSLNVDGAKMDSKQLIIAR